MFLAAREGNTAAVQLLVRLGAETGIADHLKRTPLMIAKEKNRHETVLAFGLLDGSAKSKVANLDSDPLPFGHLFELL